MRPLITESAGRHVLMSYFSFSSVRFECCPPMLVSEILKSGYNCRKDEKRPGKEEKKGTDGPGAGWGLGKCLKHTRSDLPNAFHTDQGDPAESGRPARESKTWLDYETGRVGCLPARAAPPGKSTPSCPPPPNKTKQTQIVLGRFFCLGQRWPLFEGEG